MPRRAFYSVGTASGDIDVRLSYKIVELFSEGLYTSPNKAIEELVANSFDAGATDVHVLLSPNLHHQGATIAVIDDGEGMDADGLERHWLIGVSNKRSLSALPRGRQQIGKFGIGKLSTYVLANRLTHISRTGSNYYSTSMDFKKIDDRVGTEVEPTEPVRISLRKLTAQEARTAIEPWTSSKAFPKEKRTRLFARSNRRTWTVTVMSSLKPKVHEIQPGMLRWILSTALPLRPDFSIALDGKPIESSKLARGRTKQWILGKDIVDLPKPGPKRTSRSKLDEDAVEDFQRYGITVPNLGRVTGYAEAYADLITGGKSEDWGRSHGFFVYVRGRLLNVDDGHFGISPDELRHGTFGRFRLVVHIDGLDEELRSNREAVGDGPLLQTARDLLRAVFNFARPVIEAHEDAEEPGVKLARKLASSPASLSHGPIIELAKAVATGRRRSRHLSVPPDLSPPEQERFIEELETRRENREHYVTGVSISFDSASQAAYTTFEPATGNLRLNGYHPFVATFYDEFNNAKRRQPLELIAMAEVLAEAHLHSIGVKLAKIDAFLSARDQLLRYLTDTSGRRSSLSIANALREARNSPDALEDATCAAFSSLGFDVTPLGKKGRPDGVATAYLAAEQGGSPRSYKVSLEAKSKLTDGAKISAKGVGVADVARHRDKFDCDHAVVVGPAFPTSKGRPSAVSENIANDREASEAKGTPKTITLVNVDDLARLVRIRPLKRIGLVKLRELFSGCELPEESAEWIEECAKADVDTPPYHEIIETVETLQKEFPMEPVSYSALRVRLALLQPPVTYQTDDEVMELCRGLAQMAPEAMFARPDFVELDQSAENVVVAIDSAMLHYPVEDVGQ